MKQLTNFWKTLQIPWINCEIDRFVTWSSNCVIYTAPDVRTFAVTDGKLYVSVVTLSTQENANLLQQLNSGFKRTMNWSKYQPKVQI